MDVGPSPCSAVFREGWRDDMPWYDVLSHPAQVCYLLALEHGEQLHPVACAFYGELAADGDPCSGAGIIIESYETINERRASRGLPPIPHPGWGVLPVLTPGGRRYRPVSEPGYRCPFLDGDFWE
jgi:hypothetical protein